MIENVTLKVPKKVVLQFAFLGCVLFQLLMFYLIGVNQTHIEILKYELLIIYFAILLYSFKRYGAFNLYVIFLYTMFIFLYARVLFDLLGEWDWSFGNLMDNVYFPLNIQFQLLSLLIISLLLIHLGYLYNRDVRTDHELEFKFEAWPALEAWALFFFILALPGTVYKYWIELQVILQNGYLAVFDGTLDNLDYPIWTAGAGTLFICSYAVFISARPEKRKFIIVSSIFFLLNILNTLKGSRSKVFVPLLYLLWLYFTFYKKEGKISFYKLALFVIISIVFSQWMTAFRAGSSSFDTSELLILFFLQQGVSVLVLGYMLYYKDIFINSGVPYIFAPLITMGFGQGQTFETIQKTHMLSYKLTYFLSPTNYYNGHGVGSSFLAEFYDLGIIPFIIMCILTGYLIGHFVNYTKNSRIMLLLSFFIVQNIIFMPRSNFFPMLIEIIFCILFYFVLVWFSNKWGIVRLKLT